MPRAPPFRPTAPRPSRTAGSPARLPLGDLLAEPLHGAVRAGEDPIGLRRTCGVAEVIEIGEHLGRADVEALFLLGPLRCRVLPARGLRAEDLKAAGRRDRRRWLRQ